MNTPVVPELTDLFIRFGLALALGLFIGFEREKEKHETFAGIRTFPLISLLGVLPRSLMTTTRPGFLQSALSRFRQ